MNALESNPISLQEDVAEHWYLKLLILPDLIVKVSNITLEMGTFVSIVDLDLVLIYRLP